MFSGWTERKKDKRRNVSLFLRRVNLLDSDNVIGTKQFTLMRRRVLSISAEPKKALLLFLSFLYFSFFIVLFFFFFSPIISDEFILKFDAEILYFERSIIIFLISKKKKYLYIYISFHKKQNKEKNKWINSRMSSLILVLTRLLQKGDNLYPNRSNSTLSSSGDNIRMSKEWLDRLNKFQRMSIQLRSLYERN